MFDVNIMTDPVLSPPCLGINHLISLYSGTSVNRNSLETKQVARSRIFSRKIIQPFPKPLYTENPYKPNFLWD